MKNKSLLIACVAFASSVFSLNAYANTMDIQDDCDGHDSIYPAALHEQMEFVVDAVDATFHAAMTFVSETLELNGEVPSGDEIQAYVLAQEGTLSQEELEEALGTVSEQTSAGNRIPLATYRGISLTLLVLSYNYPEVWPITLLFLLDADRVIGGWIQESFDSAFLKVGLTGVYYGFVIKQFEQFQREFKRFLGKQGYNLEEYSTYIIGTIFATYKYLSV